jgi:transcription antitermination factor NusG
MSKQWFIVHTYSGFEKKVKESLEGRVAAFGLTDKIGQIIIPTESVVEVRGGKKVISPRLYLARGAFDAAGDRVCGFGTDSVAADGRRSTKHFEPGYDDCG